MDDQNQNEDQEMATKEREGLETKANMLGVKFHPSLSNEKLAERIKEHLEKDVAPKVNTQKNTEVENEAAQSGQETENQKRLRLKREATELVRIVVQCKNPGKKDWPGQIFSVGNSLVGQLQKYVPFEAENGWHVPRMILKHIKSSQYQHFYSDAKNPNITLSKWVKEFVVDELPPLTKEELHDLAQRQAMANSID